MASDNFAGSPGTALDTYNANWQDAGANGIASNLEIVINDGVAAVSGNEFSAAARWGASSSDTSIVTTRADAVSTYIKFGPCVRMTATHRGYYVLITDGSSTGVWDSYQFMKDGAELAASTFTSKSRGTSWDFKIVATDNGANVDLELFEGANSLATYQDTSAVYTSGSPGIICWEETYNVITAWADGSSEPVLSADSGAYTYSGADVSFDLQIGRTLTADTAAYAYTGADATLTSKAIKTLTADAGSYTYSGTDANSIYTTTVVGTAGVYALTGAEVVPDWSLSTDLTLASDAGAYSVAGNDVTMTLGDERITLTSDAGAYRFVGGRVTFTLVQSTQWSPISDKTPGWSPDEDASTTWTSDTDKSTTWV